MKLVFVALEVVLLLKILYVVQGDLSKMEHIEQDMFFKLRGKTYFKGGNPDFCPY